MSASEQQTKDQKMGAPPFGRHKLVRAGRPTRDVTHYQTRKWSMGAHPRTRSHSRAEGRERAGRL